jgi:ribose transport system permease protein
MQFIPCVEVDPATGQLTDFSVEPEQFGDFLCAVFDRWYNGGNPEASIDAGIRLGRHMMINFIIVGFFAALAGVLLASQMGAATPNLGRDYELWVITAVVLGGTKLTGGYGSIVGTLGGVLAIGILRNGMNLMQVPAFYVLVILGAILISVLIIDKKLNAPSAKEVRI